MATQAQLRADPSLVRSKADVRQLTAQQQAMFAQYINGVNAANPNYSAPEARAPKPQLPGSTTQQGASAFAMVKNYLDQWGLSGLATWAWDRYRQLGGGTNAMSQIQLEMPDQPAFQARFPAYKTLQQQGRAMTVADMLSYEKQAVGIMQAAGLPSGFYDQPQDLAKFMAGQVSINELQQRVQLASQAALAPHETKDALQQMYGIGPSQLTAYYLDPSKALPVIQQQFTAGQIGAAANTTGFGGVTGAQAADLAARGVTESQAQQGFSQLAQLQPLMNATASDQTAIGTPEQISAQFQQNAQAQQDIQTRKARRLATFGGGSGFGQSSSGVGGLGNPNGA